MAKDIVQQISTHLSLQEKDTEVETLLTRLNDIEPKDMAEALFVLEFHKELGQVVARCTNAESDHSQLIFSRSMKDEIQTIYLELAKHLRAQSHGSTQLMNAVFDFFNLTLKSLVKVPLLVSSN